MAFNNSVPVKLNVSHDNGTNLITFTLTTYSFNGSTGLYDIQQGAAEVIEIPADVCSHNEVIGKVVTVQNASQDEFEITTGWYDVVNDTHYPNPGQTLVDLIDTYIALNTGGGGGATLFYQLTEAQAITAIINQTLQAGATYQISLDGTSEGNNGDYINLVAIDIDVFAQNVTYYHISEAQFVVLTGVFNASGWTFKSCDPTADLIVGGKFDESTDTLAITGYEPFGIWPIAINQNEDLATITGGFEGMEITIYATGGGAFALSVLNTGNIVLDTNLFTPPYGLTDNNTAYIRLKKRGSNWLQQSLLII